MATCTRCNRPLKDPISVQRGYGPVCWATVQADRERAKYEDNGERHLDEPLDEFIVCSRDEKGIATNVPHLVTHHSPTGFEFGYGGSGPADLALNILEAVLSNIGYKGARTKDTWRGDSCFRLAFELHQPFKRDFIATMDRAGGRIYTNDIIAWVKAHEPMVGEQS